MVAGPDPDPLRGFLSGTLTDLRAQAWAELSVTSQKISPSLSDSELLKAGLRAPLLCPRCTCSCTRFSLPRAQRTGRWEGSEQMLTDDPLLPCCRQDPNQRSSRRQPRRFPGAWSDRQLDPCSQPQGASRTAWAPHPRRSLARSWTWVGSRGPGAPPASSPFHSTSSWQALGE